MRNILVSGFFLGLETKKITDLSIRVCVFRKTLLSDKYSISPLFKWSIIDTDTLNLFQKNTNIAAITAPYKHSSLVK